jgi:hypothetical protein
MENKHIIFQAKHVSKSFSTEKLEPKAVLSEVNLTMYLYVVEKLVVKVKLSKVQAMIPVWYFKLLHYYHG